MQIHRDYNIANIYVIILCMVDKGTKLALGCLQLVPWALLQGSCRLLAVTQHHSIYKLWLFRESANFKRQGAKTEPELYTLIWKKKRGRERKGPSTTILTDARTQLKNWRGEEKNRLFRTGNFHMRRAMQAGHRSRLQWTVLERSLIK